MISTKIKAAELKILIFMMIIIHDQHIIIHMISVKIKAVELKTD